MKIREPPCPINISQHTKKTVVPILEIQKLEQRQENYTESTIVVTCSFIGALIKLSVLHTHFKQPHIFIYQNIPIVTMIFFLDYPNSHSFTQNVLTAGRFCLLSYRKLFQYAKSGSDNFSHLHSFGNILKVRYHQLFWLI